MFTEQGIDAPMSEYDGHRLMTVKSDFVAYEPWLTKIAVDDQVRQARLMVCADLVDGRWEYFTSIQWLN